MMQLATKGKEIASHVVRGTSSGCDDGLHAWFCSGNAVNSWWSREGVVQCSRGGPARHGLLRLFRKE